MSIHFPLLGFGQDIAHRTDSQKTIADFKKRSEEFRSKLEGKYLEYGKWFGKNEYRAALRVLDEIKDEHYGTEFKYDGDASLRFDCYYGMRDWVNLIKFEKQFPHVAKLRSAFIAEAYFRLGNYGKAIELSDPKEPQFYQLHEGREDFPKVFSKKDLEMWIKLQQGYKYFKNGGKLSYKALDYFIAANRLKPNVPVCLFYLAGSYESVMKLEEARAVYRKLSTMDSRYKLISQGAVGSISNRIRMLGGESK